MSCFAKIKSPLNGKTITSPAYYQLTSFFPPAQGKKIYEALTTPSFKTEIGFDWTRRQQGYNPKLNFAGEPTLDQINTHLRLNLNPREIRAGEQMDEVASLGYLNKGYANPNAFNLITNEINLNPKYSLIESEVLARDGKYYLSVKPAISTAQNALQFKQNLDKRSGESGNIEFTKDSVVTNKDGSAIVVFNNTNEPATRFTEGRPTGLFFTPNVEMFSEYGATKYGAILNIRNPYYAANNEIRKEADIQKLKDAGYDGVITHPEYRYDRYVAVSTDENAAIDEYIKNQNINNNVKGKDNRESLDLSKALEFIVFNSEQVKVLDSADNKSLSTAPAQKSLKPVSKDYLRTIKFPDMIVNNVADFSNAGLIELMDNLLKNKELPPFQHKMLERLRNLMKINPTLKLAVFDDAEVDEEFQRSFYDPKSNTIYIGKTVTSEFNKESFARELIHEAVHAYTISALTNPITAEEIKFRQEMERYISEYKSKFPRLQHHYGFKNVEEFVSEYLSNPYFRNDLQEAERTNKDKTFVGRVTENIKRFLKNVLGLGDTLFDRVNQTVDEYFDYLDNLEDMPDLAGEHELRFNQPYAAQPLNPLSVNLSQFQQYVDSTFNSSSWKQLSQGLSEIDPRFASIERIREKFGNISSASLGSTIKSSIDYLVAIEQLVDRVIKDVDLHRNNLGYYSSEDAVSVFNHAIHIADFVQEQMAAYNQYLMPQLRMEQTKTDLDINPIGAAEFRQERRSQVENFDIISQELIAKLKNISDRSNSLRNEAKSSILAPVASQLSEPFRLIAAQLKEPNSQLNQEIDAKEKLYQQALASNQNKKAADMLKDLNQLRMFRDWVPTQQNIIKLLQTGMNPEYTGANFFTVYLGVANMTGSPLVQVVKEYLDVHLTEAGNKSLEYTNRASKLFDKVEARNKKQGIRWTQSIDNFYKNLTREVEMVYYDANGVRRVVKQLAYNTKFKEAEFRNDLQELKRNVDSAKKGGVEAEIVEAEENLQKFLDNYAVRPYTDEYYEAEDLLISEAREARTDLLDQLEEHQAVFGDAEASQEERKHRTELRRAYERLGSIYNEDGTEKPKGTKERNIADSIIAYKNKRKALEAIEFVIPDKVKVRFEIEKNSRKQKVADLERKISILNTDIADEIALGQDVTTKQNELVDITAQLEVAKTELNKWLNANTRTEIDPEFFELQRSIADKIRNIFLKYGEDPLLSEAYDELFNSVKGYRDQDGIIVGSQIQRGLGQTIRDLETRIEKLKEDAEENRQISDQDKETLKVLFKQISDIQTKETTEYYVEQYSSVARAARVDLYADAQQVKEIKELAEKLADQYIENEGLVDEDLELDDNLPVLNHPSEFGTDKHRNDLVSSYENMITELRLQQRIKESDWYKANHISIKKSYTDKKSGKKVVKIYERPIYIWNRTIPRNAAYIKQENPNFDWAVPRVRDEYKNKDYNFLGSARPRETSDNKYTNEVYTKSLQDDKDIADEMVALYEDIQRNLPVSQRLEGYVVPNKVRDAKENITDMYTNPLARFRGWVDGWKLIFKPGLAGEDQYEDEISSLVDAEDKQKIAKSNRKVQLIKTRYKEPLNTNQVSRVLVQSLAEYGAYASEFAGLKKAMPGVFAAREAALGTNIPARDVQMLDNEIKRFFYGGEVSNTSLGDNPYMKATMRAMRRIFRFSQSRVLLFNFLRVFKNIFNNFLKIVLSKNKYGLTRKELLRAWWKGLRMRRSLVSLEIGSKQHSEYALKLVHFRALPAADPTKLATNVHQTSIYKYANAENFSGQIFGYMEMASTIPIYEALIARLDVPIVINGQQTTVNLSDAYEVIDGILVPKEGVFGLELNAMRSLVEDRKQIISTFLAQEGVSTIEKLSSAQKTKLKGLLTSIDVQINSLEKVNSLKQEKLRLVEQQLRDQIHELYTSTQGNYYKRSRSAYEQNLFASVVMSMRRWLAPNLQTNFGGRRLSLYTGNLEGGFYAQGGKSLLRKIRYLVAGERMDLGSTEFEKEKHQRIFRDTLNVVGLHAISLGLTSLLFMGLGGGGDDDPSKLLSILAIISLGTYDEAISLHPLLAPSNWIYKTFFRQPLARPGDEEGGASSTVRHGLYALFGPQMRSFDQIFEAIFDSRNITDPFEPYYEQRRDMGGNSIVNTPAPTRGLPRVLAMAMKFYGVESGLKPFYAPRKRVMDMLKLNPMLGMHDPLGDYLQIQQKISALQKDILARDPQDNIYFMEGEWDKMSKPDVEEMKTKVAEWGVLKVEKMMMESTNPVIEAAKMEKDISAYEGSQDVKQLEFMLQDFYDIKLPKAPKNEQTEFYKSVEKAFQKNRRSSIKESFDKLQQSQMSPD